MKDSNQWSNLPLNNKKSKQIKDKTSWEKIINVEIRMKNRSNREKEWNVRWLFDKTIRTSNSFAILVKKKKENKYIILININNKITTNPEDKRKIC